MHRAVHIANTIRAEIEREREREREIIAVLAVHIPQ